MENNDNKKGGVTRRDFVKSAALSAAAFTIVPRHVLGGPGYIPPSDKLNIAGVGVGGRGQSVLKGAYANGANNIVALCDVDDERAAKTYAEYPNAKRFKDYRKMIEIAKEYDGVMICTPDHTHAMIAMAFMQMGKHVYVEKPLTHNLYEARMLTQAARKYNVATQMGNQGNSGDDARRMAEWIAAGLIGDVTNVHCWTNRPIWPQGRATPTDTPPVPAGLDWDLWQGPAKPKAYQPIYVPFGWRGWWEYGTGSLGDMACHIVEPVFFALKLGYPLSVEASVVTIFGTDWKQQMNADSCPSASIIHFEYGPRGNMPGLKLHWYDGGMMPQRPEELKDDEPMGDWSGGVIFEGTKGKIMCDCYGLRPRLLPLSKMEGFKEPAPTLARIPGSMNGHQTSWVAACKAGGYEAANKLASSNFEHAGRLTEMVLMGNLALRSMYLKDGDSDKIGGKRKLLWDGEKMQITNFAPANQFIKREYRDGWSLGV
jgi:predicted dehydrogenase